MSRISSPLDDSPLAITTSSMAFLSMRLTPCAPITMHGSPVRRIAAFTSIQAEFAVRFAVWSVLAALWAVALPPSAAAQEEPAPLGRFAIEAVGGTTGSVAGVAIGFVIADPADCDSEDITCILNSLGLAGVLAAAGAPVGTTLLGNARGTGPSLLGAAIGSLAGVALGVGVVKLVDEAGASLGSLGAGVVFTVSHGLVTAVGSRVAAALR